MGSEVPRPPRRPRVGSEPRTGRAPTAGRQETEAPGSLWESLVRDQVPGTGKGLIWVTPRFSPATAEGVEDRRGLRRSHWWFGRTSRVGVRGVVVPASSFDSVRTRGKEPEVEAGRPTYVD